MSYAMDEVISLGLSLKGMKEMSAQHADIINVYNSHKPLARGYAARLEDPWCMIFISYLFIEKDMVPALGITECGCEEYLTYAKEHNMCTDKPVRGDLILYDWDGKGRATHIGIVVSVDQYGYMEVLEGNKTNTVGIRALNYRCPFIRAIVRPNYSNDKTAAVYDEKRVSYAVSHSKQYAGLYTVVVDDFLALRYDAKVTDDNMITQILPGESVRCYGFYTNDWLLVTYKDKKGFVNKLHLRRV